MKRTLYLQVTAMLLVIALLGVGITVFTAPRSRFGSDDATAPSENEETVRVVTSFYPVYIAALNVAGGVDGVEVINMVDGQVGCLHDYQMSPQDRKTLSSADVFVMNGAGAEPFLDAVLAQETDLTVIDLTNGMPLLESEHVHEEDGHEHSADETEAMNAHVWVSPRRYRTQIEMLRDGLMQADPTHAKEYEQNAAAYIESIHAVWQRMQQAAQPFLQTDTIVFHDSLAYLAEDLGLQVAASLNVGEDSGVSTDAIKRAEAALGDEETAMFLYDSQYETVGYVYLQSLVSQPLVLTADTCVSGDGAADSWLAAMTRLCQDWEAVSVE